MQYTWMYTDINRMLGVALCIMCDACVLCVGLCCVVLHRVGVVVLRCVVLCCVVLCCVVLCCVVMCVCVFVCVCVCNIC